MNDTSATTRSTGTPLDVVDREITQVRALVDDDARVRSQRRDELAVPHVDGVDPLGAGLQQHLGETTCRGTGVERTTCHGGP